VTPAEEPLDLVGLLVGHTEFLGEDPAGFLQDDLAGPKFVFCQQQSDDIRAKPACRKGADQDIRVEEDAHLL
jgi:hypothetical protein